MIIGIDLGTTNSLAAVWRDGKAQLIPNVHGDVLTPSVVGISDDGQVLVGQAAKERLVLDPQRTASVFKRRMGSDWTFKSGSHSFRAEELSALVLKSLKEDAEVFLGEPVESAVITVPAYFNDLQRKATQTAGRLAGLKVERLLNEPTAAAMAYGLHLGGSESRFAVLDLGGGTFDVSVLHYFEGVIEVRACAGDNYLGGEDFVDLLAAEFERRTGGRPSFADPGEERRYEQALRRQGEMTKRELSQAGMTVMALRIQGERREWALGREEFEALARPLLVRAAAPIERALRDARLNLADLDQVVLAGGASRMPMFRDLVAKLFGQEPACVLDPDQVIAMGAAVQVGLMQKDQALRDVVMTDVCPYSLGVEIVGPDLPSARHLGGRFLPVLERNMPIPYSRVERVFTVNPGQRQVDLKVFQGESRYTRDNIYLGTLEMPMPRAGEGQPLDVRLTYEVNGLLEVEATAVESGLVKKLVLQQNPSQLSDEEVAERFKKLALLKMHPRAQGPNALLLARAERIFEEHLGEVRSQLESFLRNFEEALEGQRLEKIEPARKQLREFLDSVEGRGGA